MVRSTSIDEITRLNARVTELEAAHDATWNAAIEAAAKEAAELSIQMVEYPDDAAKEWYEAGVCDAGMSIERNIRALKPAHHEPPTETVERNKT